MARGKMHTAGESGSERKVDGTGVQGSGDREADRNLKPISHRIRGMSQEKTGLKCRRWLCKRFCQVDHERPKADESRLDMRL
jgi:hypothetical protein